MYLADRDLKALLPQLRIETADPNQPFVAEDQIQPCSIDLRLDSTFWRQKAGRPIDLRRSKLMELEPRRYWRKVFLNSGESIVIRPKEMVLGRTYELFSVPVSHAGKLEGRSSFARMGLSIHCCADFINPGYRGRMPMQLVNNGDNAIRLFPHIPICQLMLIALSSVPDRKYGDRELQSKYMDDDGGPSYWWRDKRIRQLQKALGEHHVEERVQQDILEMIGPQEPELIERFEHMTSSAPAESFSNADDLLERFAKREDRSRLWARVRHGGLVSAGPLLLATTLGSFFDTPFNWTRYGWLHYLLWSLTAVAIPISIASLRRDLGEYFGLKELEHARREQAAHEMTDSGKRPDAEGRRGL